MIRFVDIVECGDWCGHRSKVRRVEGIERWLCLHTIGDAVKHPLALCPIFFLCPLEEKFVVRQSCMLLYLIYGLFLRLLVDKVARNS